MCEVWTLAACTRTVCKKATTKESLPDVISYSGVIRACEKGEQWQHALGLLVEMRHNDWLPDVIQLQYCYQRISEVGQWQHARGLRLRKRHNDSLADVISCSSALGSAGFLLQSFQS